MKILAIPVKQGWEIDRVIVRESKENPFIVDVLHDDVTSEVKPIELVLEELALKDDDLLAASVKGRELTCEQMCQIRESLRNYKSKGKIVVLNGDLRIAAVKASLMPEMKLQAIANTAGKWMSAALDDETTSRELRRDFGIALELLPPPNRDVFEELNGTNNVVGGDKDE